MTDTVLQIQGLGFAYPACAGTPVLTDFTAQVPAGVSLVTGGDGQGKTTLLRLLAGDLQAQQGRLSVRGLDLSTQPQAYRQQVFWTDARAARYDPMTPDAVFDALAGRHPAFRHDIAAALMDGLSLAEHAHKPLHMLSTGTRRKVLLAAGFASGAAVVLLDNPFAALDQPSIRVVKDCINEFGALDQRACVIADYEAPQGIALKASWRLGD